MLNLTDKVSVGIATLVALGIATFVGFATAPQNDGEASNPEVEVSVSTTSQTLAPPITVVATEIDQPLVIEAPRYKNRSISTPKVTSTSKVPPPLTPEQEANIQAGIEQGEERDIEAREHMPSTTDGHDFDTPSETTSTIMDTTTSAP